MLYTDACLRCDGGAFESFTSRSSSCFPSLPLPEYWQDWLFPGWLWVSMSMVGLMMLFGIVVKNGIVLIDYTVLCRERGIC